MKVVSLSPRRGMKVVSLSPIWHDALAVRLLPGISLVTLDPADRARMVGELPDADVLISTRFDADLAGLCRSLELILCPAAGTEGIDREAIPAGVELVHGTGHEIAMAEYVIGALVALRQRFQSADAALRQGRWMFGFFGSRGMVDELYGSTLGLIGFGRIGMEVARRARAFGMRCRAVTLHPDKQVGRELEDVVMGALSNATDVDALLAASDAVVIACELSSLTAGLIDARRLALMGPQALLVNVARGPIVQEQALYEALASQTIAAAAIDVWYRYPEPGSNEARPSTFAFDALDNVLMTPHSSGWTPGAKERKLAFLAATLNSRHTR